MTKLGLVMESERAAVLSDLRQCPPQITISYEPLRSLSKKKSIRNFRISLFIAPFDAQVIYALFFRKTPEGFRPLTKVAESRAQALLFRTYRFSSSLPRR